MEQTGMIYKMSGNYAIIRPDEFGPTRKDVLLDNTKKEYKIGDKVKFVHEEKSGRRYAKTIQKL